MYPGTYAAQAPDRIAAVMTGTGETLSYGELERRSTQLARVLHEAGLRPGDAVALLTENSLRAFEVYWAALRSGLYITAVNNHLKPDEVAYIVSDSGATALIVATSQTGHRVEAITGLTAGVKLRLAYGGPVTVMAVTRRSSPPRLRCRSPISRTAPPCCTPRVPPAGPRESGRRCPTARCPSLAKPWWPWRASFSVSTRTRSTCRPARSTMRPRYAGAAPSRPSAAPWS